MLYIGLKDLFFMTNNNTENIQGLMVSGHKELFLYDNNRNNNRKKGGRPGDLGTLV